MKVTQGSSFWTRNVTLLAFTVFLAYVGQGLEMSLATNFFVQDLGLSGQRVLWLAGIREIPGLLLALVAALIVFLPLSRRAALALLLMAVGYGCFALVHSYVALIVAAVVASLGFHNWFPVYSALGLSLVERRHSGRILGRLSSVQAFGMVGGMGLVALLASRFSLRTLFLVSAAVLALAAINVMRLPTDIGARDSRLPRLLFRKRYWLYYVLTFFEGSRTQVFGTFGAWVLIQFYQVSASQLAILMVTSRLINSLVAPRVGDWLDRLGERTVLTCSYVAMASAFVGYALFRHVLLLSLMYIVINFLFMSRIGLDSYVNRIAPYEELAPTLTTGVSVNHVTSVSMSLVAGSLVSTLGYRPLCYGAAVMILLSCPFALSLRVPRPEREQALVAS